MVPANDAQEPEPTAPQITAGNKPPTASSDSTARLTPMPAWLMHWWTPLAIAEGLLRWTLLLAFFWGGQPHWPSSKAMKLCLTITGAGLAFSAWQQRSHDNAANAKQTQAAVERDDYWKRREQIFQLLGSKNPTLRLGAVELLAELADTTSRASIFSDSEKQELQRHIIDTLCLQVRQEGATTDDTSKQDRLMIQQAIINIILRRINIPLTPTPYADWSQQTINLSNCIILMPITISNITTKATLNFEKSIFLEKLSIRKSTFNMLQWEASTFQRGIEIIGTRGGAKLYVDVIPKLSHDCIFTNTTFVTQSIRASIKISESATECESKTDAHFNKCEFQNAICRCPDHCDCNSDSTTLTCRCWSTHECTCDTECINSDIEIIDNRKLENAIKNPTSLCFTFCRLATLEISMSHAKTDISIEANRIDTGLMISFSSTEQKENYEQFLSDPDGCIHIKDNYFWADDKIKPIRIYIKTTKAIKPPIQVSRNYLINPSASGSLPPQTPTLSTTGKVLPEPHYPLSCKVIEHEPELFHFEGPNPSDLAEGHTYQWKTGCSRSSRSSQ